MIKARHNWLINGFFDRYIESIIRKDFHSIAIEGSWKPAQKGSLIIGNHITWWDGFWTIYLNKRFLRKKIHIMQVEEQLKKRKYFTGIGAFSISPNSRDVIESLDYTASLLRNPSNAVLIYPQGIMQSMYNSSFSFKRGVERILKSVPTCQVLFYAAFVEYFANRKPTLFIYLKEADQHDHVGRDTLQQHYQLFYDECLKHQSKMKV